MKIKQSVLDEVAVKVGFSSVSEEIAVRMICSEVVNGWSAMSSEVRTRIVKRVISSPGFAISLKSLAGFCSYMGNR